MNNLAKYIEDTLGVKIVIKDVAPDKLKALPFFMVNDYDFKKTKLFNREIIFMLVKENFTAEKIRKHLDIAQKTFNAIIIAVIEPIEAYNRLRLVEKKVPFIIPGKQMYMPYLLIDFKEYAVIKREIPQIMQPAAQCLLLYHIQVQSLEGLNLKSIAEKLYYNPMTITRAAYFLHNTGICKLEGTKDKFLRFEKNAREIWNETKTMVTNPVKKSIYYTGWVNDKNLYKTNINALAHYSDINDDVIEYYAVKPGYTKFIEGANLKNFGQNEGNICIEEWKYDPGLLAKDGIVDPLSLYLSLNDMRDERIEMALEQIIEKYIW